MPFEKWGMVAKDLKIAFDRIWNSGFSKYILVSTMSQLPYFSIFNLFNSIFPGVVGKILRPDYFSRFLIKIRSSGSVATK